jgi:multicomponent Na+:H+ antiporter subunit D
VLTLAAQVITAAALGRAAWLGFFRPRPGDYEWQERMRPGMLTALVSLGTGDIAFGVFGPAVLRRLMAPAAASLLHPVRYEPLPVRLLRAAHTGSANDYAGYAIAGTLIVIAALRFA